MEFTKNQIYIAVGAGVLLVLIFGYLAWLNKQGPVLERSADRDTLTGHPELYPVESLCATTPPRKLRPPSLALDERWQMS